MSLLGILIYLYRLYCSLISYSSQGISFSLFIPATNRRTLLLFVNEVVTVEKAIGDHSIGIVLPSPDLSQREKLFNE